MSSKLSRCSPALLAHNPRCTESAWRRYEAIVLKAVAIYPRPYIFIPEDLTVESVLSKLRDAIRGKLAFDYPSKVTVEALTSWWDEVVVSREGDAVRIGPPRNKQVELVKTQEVSKNGFMFDTLTPEEVTAFALLLNNNRIQGPVRIKDAKHLPTLAAYRNVEDIIGADGSLTLI